MAEQAAPVEDLEPAAAVADQPALAQRTGGSSNACATHAQHVGHEFMRDVELVGVRPIASHQQPTGRPRLHDMEAGASALGRWSLKALMHPQSHR
jgi:hypothetical protein